LPPLGFSAHSDDETRGGHGLDPFAPSAHPRAYVPRAATEAALAALASAAHTATPAALVAPVGMGKTLLLHVLAERVGRELRYVILPHASLSLPELACWALARLGLRQHRDSVAALGAHGRELSERGSALVLLVDAAHTLSYPAARELGRLVARSQRAIRIVLAADATPLTSSVLEAISAEIAIHELAAPLTRDEADAFIDKHLDRAAAAARVRERLHARVRAELLRETRGIPGALAAAASARLAARLGGAASAEPERISASRSLARGARREGLRASNPLPRKLPTALAPMPTPAWVAAWTLAAALALALAGIAH
jgi:type II secretory pathway predicted ATPase ExeA